MQVNRVSNNSFGLKLPMGMERTLWWKMVNFPPITACDQKAAKLTEHLRKIGAPKTRLKDLGFQVSDIGGGKKELFTSVSLKVGKTFDRSTEFETLTQQSSEPFTLQHLMDAFSTMIAKIERGYIKSRTFLSAGERIQEGKPLVSNKNFQADLKKIDKAVPGYHDFKKRLYGIVTSAEELIK